MIRLKVLRDIPCSQGLGRLSFEIRSAKDAWEWAAIFDSLEGAWEFITQKLKQDEEDFK